MCLIIEKKMSIIKFALQFLKDVVFVRRRLIIFLIIKYIIFQILYIQMFVKIKIWKLFLFSEISLGQWLNDYLYKYIFLCIIYCCVYKSVHFKFYVFEYFKMWIFGAYFSYYNNG